MNFRKQVGAREVAIVVVLALGIIQFVYWRLLVYRDPPSGGGPGGPGPMPPPLEAAAGLEAVQVDTLVGVAPGFSDGPSWQARFCGPNALAMRPDGSLIVADSRNHRIREVTPGGKVTTLAGGGDPGSRGDRAEGPAGSARFRYPSGVAVRPDGAILISDTGNHRICRLEAGTVSVLAGGSRGARDGQGPAAQFEAPAALTLGPDGAAWVLDAGAGRVRRVDAAGQVTSPAQVPEPIRAALGLERPKARIAAWRDREWESPELTSFSLHDSSAAAASEGSRIFADPEQNVVLLQRTGEAPALIAGRLPSNDTDPLPNDNNGLKATFSMPCAVVAAPDGTIHVAEYEGSRIRRIRLPDWLRSGTGTAPEPRGRWRGTRGN